MRDFLSATRERVLVYDGGMGATLEQFDLSLERDYKLPGRCHEALVLNRPDVIEGVHQSMLEAGAHVLETDTFQGYHLRTVRSVIDKREIAGSEARNSWTEANQDRATRARRNGTWTQ